MGKSNILGVNLSTAEEIKRLCGHLTQKQMHVKFSIDDDDDDTESESSSDDDGAEIIPRQLRDESDESCTAEDVEAFQKGVIKIESDDECSVEEKAGQLRELDNDDEDVTIIETPIKKSKGQPREDTTQVATSETNLKQGTMCHK